MSHDYLLHENTAAQFTVATATVLDTLLMTVMNAADRKKVSDANIFHIQLF